jgi:hypothetical protein
MSSKTIIGASLLFALALHYEADGIYNPMKMEYNFFYKFIALLTYTE